MIVGLTVTINKGNREEIQCETIYYKSDKYKKELGTYLVALTIWLMLDYDLKGYEKSLWQSTILQANTIYMIV